MIKGKHGKADFNSATRFQVKYLGSTITQEAGVVGIESAVRRIRQEAKTDGKSWPKMVLEIQSSGVKFVPPKAKSRPKESKLISLEKISYASLNRINPSIFAFNHHKGPSVVECHAVACETEEKAKSIGLALYAAFREGHFNKLRQERRQSSEQKRETEKYKEQRAGVEHSQQTSSGCNALREVSLDSKISRNGRKYDVEPPQAENDLTVDIGYDEQELERVIMDLLMTVETEKAKIEKGVE